MLAKLHYLLKPTKSFRESILKLTEGWREDVAEKLTADIASCFSQDGITPSNTQGLLAKDLWNKKEQDFLIQLICPFQALDTLIPPEIDIGKANLLCLSNLAHTNITTNQPYLIISVGLEIQFNDPSKFFVCSTNTKPKVKINGKIF